MPIIKGAFRVKKASILNSWNNVHYLLLFLEDRLVFARVGGAWANLTAPQPAVIQEQLKKFRLMQVQEILQLNKRNFQISYNDIVRIKLINETKRGIKTGTLSIMTLKNDTFEIPPYQDFETCFNIVRGVLRGKLDGSGVPAGSQPDTIFLDGGIPMAESNLPWGKVVVAAQQAATMAGTNADSQTIEDMEKAKNERAVKNSANWFFLIAGLSVVNSIFYLSGGKYTFLIGLGITQFIAGFAKGFGEGQLIPFAVILTLLIAAMFAALGLFSRKLMAWAFVTGIILYILDALLFIWVKDWLSFGFHVIALYFLVLGVAACFRLKKTRQIVVE
jgi:hypothetical protein